jgi:hypothetical protein
MLNHNIIAHCQSGFTKGDSAINQLVNITNNIGKALDDERNFELFSAMLARHSIKFGIVDFCIN